MELSKEQAERIVDSKDVVEQEGIYRARVTNVTPYQKLRSNGVKQIAIVNINLKSAYHEAEANALLAQGDYEKAANQGLSLSILENQFCPTVGQFVDVVIEQVTTQGGITGLFAQTCSPAPVMKARKSKSRSMTGQSQTEGVSALAEETVAPFDA